MIDFSTTQLSDIIRLGSQLRALGTNAESIEHGAQRIVDHLYNEFRHGESRSCALVRLYKTHPLSGLDADLSAFASRLVGNQHIPQTSSCLVLMATRGDLLSWNDRRASEGHQAIPLPDAAFIERIPMIAELFRQFGLSPASFLDRDERALIAIERSGCHVFLVEEAQGSPYIPAQDFVLRHGIRSVLAFGGILPGAQLFAVLLFSKLPVSRTTADLLRALSHNVKLALLPLCAAKTFA